MIDQEDSHSAKCLMDILGWWLRMSQASLFEQSGHWPQALDCIRQAIRLGVPLMLRLGTTSAACISGWPITRRLAGPMQLRCWIRTGLALVIP